MTISQQIGVCLVGWVLSIPVIHVVYVKIEMEIVRYKENEEQVAVLLALVFWFGIFLIIPK